MSRSVQFIGLNKRGKLYVSEHASQNVVIPSVESNVIYGFINDIEHVCSRYIDMGLDNPRIFEEYLQTSPWSSGPMLFLALRWIDTKQPIEETLWIEDESVRNQEYDSETGKYWV